MGSWFAYQKNEYSDITWYVNIETQEVRGIRTDGVVMTRYKNVDGKNLTVNEMDTFMREHNKRHPAKQEKPVTPTSRETKTDEVREER